jgi:hypothetical protein
MKDRKVMTKISSDPRRVTIRVIDNIDATIHEVALPPIRTEVSQDLLLLARWEVARFINQYPDDKIVVEIERIKHVDKGPP